MKKQILILVLAIFAVGFSSIAYGQTCPTARAVDATCLPNSAISPLPGTAYDYTVTIPSPTTGTNEFLWFVTTDPNFIVTPGTLTANRETAAGVYLATTGVGYNDVLTGTASINLTWEYFDPTIPVFVIIQVKNTDATCTTQNMKVYKIEPQNAFTLDIANVDQAGGMLPGYGSNYDFCVHDIVSATYNATAPEGVVYDFGADTLFFIVTAANFSTSWMPSIQVSNFAGMGEITYVGWTRPGWPTAGWIPMTLAAGAYSPANPVLALNASGTVGATGECIIIKVAIDHSTTVSYEGLTSTQVAVAVDGKTALSETTPLGDIHFSATIPEANTLCGLPDGFQYDVALQTLKPRPTITDATPPAGNDYLPVQP